MSAFSTLEDADARLAGAGYYADPKTVTAALLPFARDGTGRLMSGPAVRAESR